MPSNFVCFTMPSARDVPAGLHSRCTNFSRTPRPCQRTHVCRSRAGTEQVQDGKPLVQYQPRARKVAPAPSEVPVVHSSSYLLKEKEQTFKASRRQPTDTAQSSDDLDSTSNAVDWALRRADAYFDKVEAETSEHSAARMIVQNPATRATMKTMQGVTTLGAATAPQLAKAALPIGKKLLSLSADVVVAGVSALNDAAKKNKDRSRTKDK